MAASEEVGMAEPTALQVAVAAMQAVQMLGMPEGRHALAQAVVHIATAPKSNAAYAAMNSDLDDVRDGKGGVVPGQVGRAHSRTQDNMPTLMKSAVMKKKSI